MEFENLSTTKSTKKNIPKILFYIGVTILVILIFFLLLWALGVFGSDSSSVCTTDNDCLS